MFPIHRALRTSASPMFGYPKLRICYRYQSTLPSAERASSFIPLKSETPSLTQQKSDPDAVQTPKPKSYRFYVKRSKSNNLPVYHETRAHGSNVVTSIRKISGDVDDLKSLLQKELKLDNKHIVVNSLTKAIKIKGHRREEIIAYLESLGL